MSTKEKEIFTTEEAAEMMGCSTSTIEEHARNRVLWVPSSVEATSQVMVVGCRPGLANHLAIPAHRGGPCRRDQTPGKLGRFGAALAGAGHSLQKASCRWLNARFTAKLKAGCSVPSSDIARSMAGYRTADACAIWLEAPCISSRSSSSRWVDAGGINE